jgi:hypothetical protein
MWDRNEDGYFHWSLHAILEASSCKQDLLGLLGEMLEYSQLDGYVVGVYWLIVVIDFFFSGNHWCISFPKISTM